MVEQQQFYLQPLPSITCSSLWPQNCKDSWWKACAIVEVALAGEPAGPQTAHLWWLPHQQMVGDDCSPLCIWVSVWAWAPNQALWPAPPAFYLGKKKEPLEMAHDYNPSAWKDYWELEASLVYIVSFQATEKDNLLQNQWGWVER